MTEAIPYPGWDWPGGRPSSDAADAMLRAAAMVERAQRDGATQAEAVAMIPPGERRTLARALGVSEVDLADVLRAATEAIQRSVEREARTVEVLARVTQTLEIDAASRENMADALNRCAVVAARAVDWAAHPVARTIVLVSLALWLAGWLGVDAAQVLSAARPVPSAP